MSSIDQVSKCHEDAMIRTMKAIDSIFISKTCVVCSVKMNQFQTCSICRSPVYCSVKCQKKDWKEGSLLGPTPHKALCNSLKSHMTKKSEALKLKSYFPWLKHTNTDMFPETFFLSQLGILEHKKSYWLQSGSRIPHGKGRADRETTLTSYEATFSFGQVQRQSSH